MDLLRGVRGFIQEKINAITGGSSPDEYNLGKRVKKYIEKHEDKTKKGTLLQDSRKYTSKISEVIKNFDKLNETSCTILLNLWN